MVKVGVFLVLVSCAMTLACGDGDDSATDDGSSTDSIEIEGTWTSNFGGEEAISDEAWTSFAAQTIIEFSNDENYAIWQNPSDAEFNPDMFGRNVWTEIEDGSFYYCTVAYMSETAEATEDDAEPADANDFETGCGALGSPWTQLTQQ